MSERSVFLDNLRSQMVLMVVLFHATLSYLPVTDPWWPVKEATTSESLALLTFSFDQVQLPALFFIAGFFAPASLRRAGRAAFIRGKVERLLVPFVALGLFFVPVIAFIRHRNVAAAPLSFWDFYRAHLATIDDVWFMQFLQVNLVTDEMGFYQPWHLWFVLYLLLLFGGFAAVIRPEWLVRHEARPTHRATLRAMGLVSVAVGGGVALLSFLSPVDAWVRLFGVLMIQTLRVPLYLGMFALGVYAETRRWFEAPLGKRTWTWGLLAFVALMGVMSVWGMAYEADGKHGRDMWLDPVSAFFFGAFHALLCVATLVVLTRIAQRRFDRPTWLSRSFAAASFHIFLLHMPIVIAAQDILSPFDLGLFAKLAIVSLVGVGGTWGLASLTCRLPRPVNGVLLAAFFGVLVLAY